MDKQTYQRILGNDTYTYRDHNGLTQGDLAYETGLSAEYLSQLENVQHMPGAWTLYQLSHTLNTDPNQFLEDIKTKMKRKFPDDNL